VDAVGGGQLPDVLEHRVLANVRPTEHEVVGKGPCRHATMDALQLRKWSDL